MAISYHNNTLNNQTLKPMRLCNGKEINDLPFDSYEISEKRQCVTGFQSAIFSLYGMTMK